MASLVVGEECMHLPSLDPIGTLCSGLPFLFIYSFHIPISCLLFLYITPESYFSFLPAQISLLEVPQHKRKKVMALTTNVMRDDSDKV